MPISEFANEKGMVIEFTTNGVLSGNSFRILCQISV